MNFHPAISGVGKSVLIIRGTKVIGKGKSQGMKGYEVVSITLEDAMAQALIPPNMVGETLGYKYTYLHYSPVTGGFLGIYENDPLWQDINKQLDDTTVVDEENFRYGVVPDHFKEVEGYRSAINTPL